MIEQPPQEDFINQQVSPTPNLPGSNAELAFLERKNEVQAQDTQGSLPSEARTVSIAPSHMLKWLTIYWKRAEGGERGAKGEKNYYN